MEKMEPQFLRMFRMQIGEVLVVLVVEVLVGFFFYIMCEGEPSVPSFVMLC